MTRKIILKVVALVLIVIIILLGFIPRLLKRSEKVAFEKSYLAMGSYINLRLLGKAPSDFLLEWLSDSLQNLLHNLENTTNFYEPSEIFRINESYPDSSIILSRQLCSLLVLSYRGRELTGGAFEPAIGPLTSLWGMGEKVEFIPSPSQLDSVLRLVGLEAFYFDSASCRIQKRLIGAKLDLGAIAKGYAADLIYDLLIGMEEVQGFLIDAGGTIRGFSRKDREFRIGLKHPRKPGALIGKFSIPSKMACATAGDYQQYFLKEGRRYHHIFDPLTGYPAESLSSVTIIAPTAAEADLLSTAVFVMGLKDGLNFINGLDKTEGIFIIVRKTGTSYYTSKNLDFEVFELE
ncbi:FAD:protein FMN transferase [bacterium]|nr:FAD:protein FMN transferase [bacterium]